MNKRFVAAILLIIMTSSVSADWSMAGAGNSTCRNWNSNSQNIQKEIRSWMAGFASAININYAARNRPELRLDLLTYEYLSREIDSVCKNKANSEERMSAIALNILGSLPRVNNK